MAKFENRGQRGKKEKFFESLTNKRKSKKELLDEKAGKYIKDHEFKKFDKPEKSFKDFVHSREDETLFGKKGTKNRDTSFGRGENRERKPFSSDDRKPREPFQRDDRRGNDRFDKAENRERKPFSSDDRKPREPFQRDDRRGNDRFDKAENRERKPFSSDDRKPREPFQRDDRRGNDRFDKDENRERRPFSSDDRKPREPFQRDDRRGNDRFDKDENRERKPFSSDDRKPREPFQRDDRRGNDRFDKDERKEHSKKSSGKDGLFLERRDVSAPKKTSRGRANHDEESVMRLNKFLAHSGVASRRNCTEIIKNGEIQVNGKTESNPAYEIQEGDVVKYHNKVVKPETKMVYLLLNKPKNVITTVSDEKGRKTVLDLVEAKVEGRVYPVGRLDRNTTGLLLITNDGELAEKLSHPSYEVSKVYQVELDKNLSESDMDKIRKGISLEDGEVEVDGINYFNDKKRNEIGIEIHSGKNRIVRRIFEHLGYEVVKLDRIQYAGLTKKDLPRGWSRPLTKKEIIMLKHFK
jgi:23S rRNA pseudouridine2605 synthase